MHPKILLIEQTGELRNLLDNISELEAFSFISTSEPSLALPLCNYLSPNLILVDFELHQFHGYQFSKQVNGGFERPNIPLIAIIHPAQILENNQFLYTVDDYLLKPIKIAQLRQSIQTCLPDQSMFYSLH
ncbi:response regulator [Roseofilum reptotaenium CS-1145]|uniref:Response regulatory domain-containing protein n=1 Tax=Roseofilum reptotaenium AO1-A TaxID=1925591 RepID=A0A1L9QNC9_9CYAN|nr:response regulator [Roseofilum reptotaenium]MDB9517080.1 response regulator [Roseofilum reptotaenium CS-1145]OJJ24175.1 hypothetical protein BI308_18075 [Roseofilum reptotaenium AO1-A]